MKSRIIILLVLLTGCAGSQYISTGQGGGAIEIRLLAPAKLSVDVDGENVYRGAEQLKTVTIGGITEGPRVLRMEADAPAGAPVVRTDTVQVSSGLTTTLTMEVPEPSPAWGFAAGVIAATFLIIVPLL